MPATRTRARAATGTLTGVLLLGLAAAPTAATPSTSTAAANGAGGVAARAAVTDAKLAARLAALMRDSRVRHARSGLTVADLSTGSVLYSRYGSTRRAPASNLKLLTAAAAMAELGPGFRFHTDVIRRGPVESGTLRGSLYLKGYGDPTTRQADFAALARQVRDAGIRTVTGDLVVDTSFFDSQAYNPHWSHSYADAYYAAQTRALTIAPDPDYFSGTVLLHYRPGASGHRPTLSTVPAAALSALKIKNTATTSSRSSTITVERRYGSGTIRVSGHLRTGSSGGVVQVAVDHPERVAAAVFRNELRKAGVTVKGATTSRTVPAGRQHRVAIDRSITLSKLLVPFLKLSSNMHAEALTKTMGALLGGGGSWPRGLAVTRRYLSAVGLSPSQYRMVDGSGLSPDDRVTPRALVTLLTRVAHASWFGAFYRALPVAGRSGRLDGGTLATRMRGTTAAGNAHAKTGSLSGVTALSGYVTGADGHRYVYAMISSYRTTSPRPVEDEVVVALSGWRR